MLGIAGVPSLTTICVSSSLALCMSPAERLAAGQVQEQAMEKHALRLAIFKLHAKNTRKHKNWRTC